MTDNPKTTISTWLDRFQSAMFRLCGTRPPADLCWDWIEADGSRLQNWVGIQPATPLWAMNIGVIDAAMILADATVEEEGHQTREEAIIQRRREKTAMSDPQTTEALVAMPGPWEVVWLQGDKLGSPSEVCAAGTDNRVAFLASNGTLGTARLIAAAPDLLALLVEARNTRAADIVPGGWADRVDAILEEINAG